MGYVVLGLILIAFLGVGFFVFCELYQFLKKTDFKAKKEQILKTLKKWYFLFRWFIIGRYYCDFKGKKCSKKAFVAIRWALLFFIIYSCTMSLAGIVDFLRPFFIKVFA